MHALLHQLKTLTANPITKTVTKIQSIRQSGHVTAMATTTKTTIKVEKHAIYRKSQATNWRQQRNEFESIRVFTRLSLGFVAEHLCPLAIITLLLQIWQNCLQCLHNVYQSVPKIKGGGEEEGGKKKMIAAKRRMGGGGRVFAVFLLLGLCVISPPVVFADTNADRVAELLHRQSKSKDGVIHLDESSFRRFMSTSDPRPYSLVIFFDASQLRDNRELRLEEFRKEFGLASLAYIKHNKGSTNEAAASRIFFCDLEFKQSQQVFKLFGVTTLPHIRYIPPGNGNVDESEEMSQSEFPRSAEGMSMFVEAKTKQKSAAIERPPPISKWQMWFLVLAFLATTPFIIKKLIAPDSPMREPRVWCTIAILVYFFSVSGGMHNIIRRMPLFMQDRNQPGKLLFFYQGSGMQLGAEGFVVGFLYTVVGLLLGFITQFASRIKSRMVQQILMLVGIAISFLAVRKVVLLDNWKTGYWIHAFWPTRWT